MWLTKTERITETVMYHLTNINIHQLLRRQHTMAAGNDKLSSSNTQKDHMLSRITSHHLFRAGTEYRSC